MLNLKLLISLLITVLLSVQSCKDIYEQEIYQKPEWLTGKLYTQVAAQEDLSHFAEWLSIIGFDTILDVSGSFTIFAPSNSAIEQFLSDNQYSSSSEVPTTELENLVRFHIIQNAWSKNQLQLLDTEGWIDPLDPESIPRAYKRQTLLKTPTEKYWIFNLKDEDVIMMDSTLANDYKLVYTRSRKYVPIYFDEFFEIYDLSPEDYSFYFNRPYEPGNIYYAEAKVIQPDIFAENGFIHVVDRVVKPMLNAKDFLDREFSGETYKSFLELIYQFPRFEFDRDETFDQQAAREGGTFDSLFTLTFHPHIPFDIHEELTGPSINLPQLTYSYHNGIYVPTDDAFDRFLTEVVTAESGYPHWPDFESIPINVKKIIVRSHFTTNPVYSSDLRNGFLDGDGNTVYLDEADIIRKEFGSNCTFLGLNNAVVPRAFSSVTGPVYLRPGFSLLLYAIELSRVLPALTREDAEYAFFSIPNEEMEADSSLMISWIDRDLNRYRFRAYSRAEERFMNMTPGILGKRILNQVGTSMPNGSADKEFIETLGGNYIIWNNRDNTVQGTLPNYFGYQGDSLIYYNPEPLDEVTDNGKAWNVRTWFGHTKTIMFSAFLKYPAFKDLIEKAGLYDPKLYSYPFLTEGEFYTIFIPSDSALSDYQADTLSGQALVDFLTYHFVKGEKIFTDNKKPWRDYETLRRDESSTAFSTVFSTLNIRPGPDVLEILDAEDNPYVTIPESAGTNIMVATDTDPVSTDDTDYIITAVIHEIDQVLYKQ